MPANPFELVFGLLSQKVTWPPAATWLLIGFGVLIYRRGLMVVRAVLRRRSKRSRVDAAAQQMAKGRVLSALSLRGATATAERRGAKSLPGVPVGKTVLGGQMVYGSREDMHIDIWGPRTGQTTSRAIRAILAAPGAALVTSNKRDIVDGTREVCAAEGPVWVFNPQFVALEEPSWWWNPLSYVTDQVKAPAWQTTSQQAPAALMPKRTPTLIPQAKISSPASYSPPPDHTGPHLPHQTDKSPAG